MKRMHRVLMVALVLMVFGILGIYEVLGQASKPKAAVRGSIIEDRAAKKLIEAGDLRYAANEIKKAVEIYQSVIERYPKSKHRFLAHMKLGEHLMKKERAFDRARAQFAVVSEETNRDEKQRAEALLKIGVCFYEGRNYGKCFKAMRAVIEKFPVSQHVNEAYYYIGLGHFQLGHYSRAIAALEKVGTALSEKDRATQKSEAGKRLFIKIEDADLAVLEKGETVQVEVKATSGDRELVKCIPVGKNVRLVLGSIATKLGRPRPENGQLELKGDDKITVTYTDAHTADRKFNEKRTQTILVVGNGKVSIMDGAFSDDLQGVVLGKESNVQVIDADRDVTDEADVLKARAEVYREKTPEELENEMADLIAKAAGKRAEKIDINKIPEDQRPKVDPLKLIDSMEIVLKEVRLEEKGVGGASKSVETSGGTDGKGVPTLPDGDQGNGKSAGSDLLKDIKADAKDDSIHSGVFRTTIAVVKVDVDAKVNRGDQALSAAPGDLLRVTYADKLNSTSKAKDLKATARCVEGNLGGVRVTRAQISDEELRLKTKLKTATALTHIGTHYKEFGLAANAKAKYGEALETCEEIVDDARKLGGRILEETYVQLWQIYFQMDKLELAAAMAQRLQREFPNSGFVDDAMLQLAGVARKQGNLNRAISLYSRLVNLKASDLRGEAQFGIAQCYDDMAAKAKEQQAEQLKEKAFQEYKKVFEKFPESGRVGEAVAKMANYYYEKKDYSRAVETFESVMSDHPDAKFLDVILFNYGRCLYRLNRRKDAKRRFDQVVGDFPESKLAAESKRISDALAKAGF